MRTRDIIRGNRLIANFHSERLGRTDFYDGLRYIKTYDDLDGTPYKYDELKFHESLDWLMPVLDKIWKQNNIIEISWEYFVECKIFVIGLQQKTFKIYYTNENEKSPIIPIWKEVIEYIKLYNKENKK